MLPELVVTIPEPIMTEDRGESKEHSMIFLCRWRYPTRVRCKESPQSL